MTWEMLEEKHMPKFYWAEAVKMVVYVQNQTSANGGVSPHELYFGKKPDLGNLWVFNNIVVKIMPHDVETMLKIYRKTFPIKFS